MTDGPRVVLDASALLAALHGEPGGQMVEAQLEHAALSTVNLAEVMQKTVATAWRRKGCERTLKPWE